MTYCSYRKNYSLEFVIFGKNLPSYKESGNNFLHGGISKNKSMSLFIIICRPKIVILNIFSSEKMGAFATLKNRVEFNLNFFRDAT